MNNGERIKELQNIKVNKRLLAAQRQTYADAKSIDIVNICICLLVPLAFTFIQIFASVSPAALLLIWAAVMVAGIYLPKKTEQLASEAAMMQQAFDSVVFGVEFEHTAGYGSRVASQAARYYKRCGSGYDDPGLDDWYSADIEGLKAGDAIARCQRQNTDWTKRLLARSIGIEFLVAIVLATVLIALTICKGIDPFNLFFLFSIIEWLFQRITRGYEVLRRVKELASALSSFRLSSRENLLRVQDRIFEYRKSSYLVPDWIYALFKNKDELGTA